ASSTSAACSYDPTSDVPTTDIPIDVLSGVDPTCPSTVSPGSTTVHTSSSIPARSGTTPATPFHHLSEMPEKEKVLLLKNLLQLKIRLSGNWKKKD
ncbi:hypothetical protein Tco_0463827, partial [Tanacetum coccineum]